ncbi:methyltransferase domain-containing protein [Mycolicibacterium farcinogenes]|uniref:SAM-dependent methyltransferase n=1 Tax=Mycolicibacterium farcinogenes TaxID=1802 RepID=UPI001C8EA2BF|nr:class I SAM-dependent methyltransferase [Mycolicibacterium farcinogenes]QZH59725.1 methyltransferase domain-containing protein [Mycolicibacterium farcinogenes]
MVGIAQTESWPRRILRWFWELAHASVTVFLSPAARYGKLYDHVFGTRNLLGENSQFVNLGYWADNPSTLDGACSDLARLTARAGGLSPGDVVVDVGCGYGDQDFLWLDEFRPERIIGVNVATKQVASANARAREKSVAQRVSFVEGAASNLPVPDGSATKVVALESAFHFPSRREFFAEALRVLRPGGMLVLADIVPLRRSEVTAPIGRVPVIGALVRGMFMADRHPIDIHGFTDALTRAGFENPSVRSIRDDVYAPFAEFMDTRFAQPEMRKVNPVGRLYFGKVGSRVWAPFMDYVIVVAEKPAG